MALNALMYRETGVCKPRELELMHATNRVLSLDASKLRDFDNGHSGGVNAIELEKVEGRYLLTGGGKGAVVIYDAWNDSGNLRHQFKCVCVVPEKYRHKFSVEAVQWYPFDNGLFTTSSTDKTLKVWDSNLLMPAETYEFNGIIYSHHMSTCATEHNLIAVGTSSSQAKLVDMRTGSNIQVLKGHSGAIHCVKWCPCLPFIVATGSQDGRVFFWDIRMAKGQLRSLDQHNGAKLVGAAHSGPVLAMEFTDSGYDLVTYGSDNVIRLWDTFTGRNQLVNYGSVCNDLSRCLKISLSTGTQQPILFIPEGELIRCFDTLSGQLIKTLSGHFRQVNCCHFNPFNQELYSGSNDRNLLVWTADYKVEELYMQEEESTQKSIHHSSKRQITEVLADTWSDDD